MDVEDEKGFQNWLDIDLEWHTFGYLGKKQKNKYGRIFGSLKWGKDVSIRIYLFIVFFCGECVKVDIWPCSSYGLHRVC